MHTILPPTPKGPPPALPGVGVGLPLLPAAVADATGIGPDDVVRRVEGWVVSRLGDGCPRATASDWHDLLADFSIRKRSPADPPRPTRTERPPEGWARFRTARRDGVTIVRLVDSSLVREQAILDLADELSDLIGAGVHRVVLDFGNVERLSSQLIAALAGACRRCSAAGEVTLRACKLRPEVADVFAITGMDAEIPTFADEREAVEAPWPLTCCVQPLPVTILSALASVAASEPDPTAPATAGDAATTRDGRPPDGPRLRLIVRDGPYAGRSFPIRCPLFVIGRGPDCQLRLDSPRVSRRHTSIEDLGGGVAVVRDLGSTNGTFLNGRRLDGQDAPLRDGDHLEVGPLRMAVALDRGGRDATPAEERVAGWLLDEGPTAEYPGAKPADSWDDDPPVPGEPVTLDGEAADARLTCSVVEGTLLITPLASHLEDEAAVGPLRAALASLFERPLPRRVVLNLDHVYHMSSLAVGVLVAHNLRLHRAGGALRLCQVPPRLMTVLDLIRLPMLLEVYPSLDDAVLTSWT